ncbi:MAG TPA: S9 family peptidase [Vicinamibacterales bacterium]|nr:S9 family peptidase [Vicinamibacterales bacterium]
MGSKSGVLKNGCGGLVLFAALWVNGLQAQAPRKVTIDDLMALRTINDVEMSPAGDRIAYTVSAPSVARNAHEPALFVIPATGGSPTRLAEKHRIFTPALPAPRLRWSADGQTVFVLAASDAGPQVLAVKADGTPPAFVTSAPQGVNAYEWSPDGKFIAYVSRDPGPSPPPVANKVGANPPATRLFVQPIATPGPVRAITPGDQYVDSIAWSPDSREIAYSFSPIVGFLAPYQTRISAADVETNTIRPIVDRSGMNVSPQFSPDGKMISFITTSERTGIIAPRGLAIASAAGRNTGLRSFPMNSAWIAEVLWTPDSQAVYVTMNEGTFATGAGMFEMPVVRVSLADGKAERLGDQRAAVQYSMSLSKDGRTLAYREVGARDVGDLVVLDVASKKTTRLTNVNPELQQLALGDLKPISWKSFDGMEIWGLLLTPPGYEGKGRLPLLVYCHGGPIGGVTLGIFPQFMHVPGQIDPYPTEAFAAAGFAVLFPMPRGGSGYGEAGHRMIINDWGGPDYKDIMAGVDHLIARGIADGDRLGVMGASYGGYMTNWIVTQTSRFKAAAAGASIADLSDLYYLTDGGDLMVEYYQRPWENPDGYRRSSPLTHVANVTTPILISHGDRDPRVPLATAQKFFKALQAHGKTVEMDIYPGGGHVFYQPQQERTVMQRNFDWMTRYIKH